MPLLLSVSKMGHSIKLFSLYFNERVTILEAENLVELTEHDTDKICDDQCKVSDVGIALGAAQAGCSTGKISHRGGAGHGMVQANVGHKVTSTTLS